MKCPECGLIDNSRVVDSRQHKWTVKRSRICNECGFKFKTFEVHESDFYRYQDRKTIGWGTSEDLTVISLRERGFSNGEIGKQLGRTKQAINLKIHRLLDSGEYFDILAELEMRNTGGVKHAN